MSGRFQKRWHKYNHGKYRNYHAEWYKKHGAKFEHWLTDGWTGKPLYSDRGTNLFKLGKHVARFAGRIGLAGTVVSAAAPGVNKGFKQIYWKYKGSRPPHVKAYTSGDTPAYERKSIVTPNRPNKRTESGDRSDYQDTVSPSQPKRLKMGDDEMGDARAGGPRDNAILTENGAYLRYRGKRTRKERHNIKNAWKHLRVNTETYTLRTHALQPWGSLLGKCCLSNFFNNSATAPNPRWVQPCHLYLLNGTINNPNGLSSTAPLAGPFIPCFSTLYSDPSQVAFIYNNAASDGTFPLSTDATVQALAPLKKADNSTYGNNYNLERTTTAGQASLNANRNGMFKWCQIKAMFYLPKQYPCRYKVMIVSFPEKIHPFFGATQEGSDLVNYTNWWSNFLKKYNSSPIEVLDTRQHQKMIVHYSKDFTSEPMENTTNDALPRIQEFNYFYRCDRLQNYDWEETNEPVQQAVAVTGAQYTQITKNCQCYPRWGKQMFLMIVSNSVYQLGATDVTSATANVGNHTITYDLLIRTSHDVVS